MQNDDIKKRISRSYRRALGFAYAAIALAVILVNTQAENLGYWILGAALTCIGLLIRIIRVAEASIIFCAKVPGDVDDKIHLESEGLDLRIARDRVEDVSEAEGYSCVKGTLIIFKNEK